MKRKLFFNTATSIIYQITYMIYGFILPKLILDCYGSEVNGLVSSINQYISIISLTEFGITTVIQASLYKPLVDNNYNDVSKVLASASKFFRRLASILVIYITLLCIIYPFFVEASFSRFYVVSLILVLSFNLFAEYVIGITSKQLIIADQNLWFCQISSTLTGLINILCCLFLVTHHVNIHVLKFCTAIIMVFNSISALLFVKIKYPQIELNIKYEGEPIKQKWNGVAQHLSSYIFSSTDVIVLTLFSTLKNVSIYAVYNMVLNGLKQLVGVFDNAVRPVMGRLWAKGEANLYEYFNAYEVVINLLSIFVFGCANSLIISFVKIYTSGVNDADYIVPMFSFVFTIAFLLQNIKNPYHTLIQSVGKFKETQSGYMISALMNICISILFVFNLGLIGVAIGTAIAAFFQFAYLFAFAHKFVFQDKLPSSLKVYFVDVAIFILGTISVDFIKIQINSITDWIFFAVITAMVWGFFIAIAVLLVYRKTILKFFEEIRK